LYRKSVKKREDDADKGKEKEHRSKEHKSKDKDRSKDKPKDEVGPNFEMAFFQKLTNLFTLTEPFRLYHSNKAAARR
jgi:hypothetical protein